MTSCVVESLVHDVLLGEDQYGQDDKRTHAYWAKDNEAAERFYIAEQAATRHVYLEIQKLWDASAGNDQLRKIFAMNKTQKQDNSVAYDTGAGSPNIHIATGHGCPACPFWSDSDEKIEYIDHYIEKRRTDSNVNNDFLDFMTPYGD